MSETEINFNIEIDGTMIVEDARPRGAVEKDIEAEVRDEWKPTDPKEGEEVSVDVEVEYDQR